MERGDVAAVALGLIFGLTLRVVFLNHNFLLLLILGTLAVSFCLFHWRPSLIFYKNILLVLFVFGLTLGVIVADIRQGYPPLNPPEDRVTLAGLIVSPPEYRASYQRFELELNQPLAGVKKILVSGNLGQELFYGQEVIVSGALALPENFTGDTGREFDYKNYLRARGVSHLLPFAVIEPTGFKKVSLRSRLYDLRDYYLVRLAQTLPEPHASLGGGITVGANDALGEVWEERIRRVGLTHIVVLSGYNVAIVAAAVGAALGFLPFVLASSVAVVGIWLFVLLVGASSTIVRAGLMATVAVVSRLTGQEAGGLFLLLIASTLMMIWNPLLLAYDASFQLSVLATAGMISVAPRLEKYFRWITKRWGLREIVTTTTATQLTVLPWLVYLIGEVSLVAPLVNALVLPAIPLAMLFTFLVAIVGAWLPLVEPLLQALAYGLLGYALEVSHLFSRLPFATTILPPIDLVLILGVYALAAAHLYKLEKKEKFLDQTKKKPA